MTFTPAFIKLAKDKGLTPEQLWASMSVGKEVVVTDTKAVKATKDAKLTKTAVPKAKTAAEVAELLPPEIFVPKAIRVLRAKLGETYEVTTPVIGPDGKPVKINGKVQREHTGVFKPKSKGINAKIDLNPVLRDYYGKDCDCRGITQALADKGVIRIKPIRGSVMIFLPEDRPESTRVSRLAEVLNAPD